MQVCPVAANTPATSPFAAACRSASGNTICGDLPPSSRVTLLMFSAAACATARPVAVDPVNATLSTPGCAASAAPVSRDSPVTTLTTPGGNPAWSNSSAKPRVEAGRVLGRLDHDGATGGQRGGELPGHQQQRRVPRRDRGDHTDRLAAGVDEVVRVRRRDLPALDLVGQPGVVVVPAAQAVQLADHLPVQLAGVVDLQPGQPLRVLGRSGRRAGAAGRPGRSRSASPTRRPARRGPRTTAASTSSGPPSGSTAHGPPVYGFCDSKVFPDSASTALPPISILNCSSSAMSVLLDVVSILPPPLRSRQARAAFDRVGDADTGTRREGM